jgi:hypothetical protein
MAKEGQANTAIEPTIIFSVLCDDVRREDNGKFMLIGLFEIIGARTFPVNHPVLYIMNCWGQGLGPFTQKTRILGPDNSVIAQDRETAFELKDLKSKHRIISKFNNIRFAQPGEYAVEVMLSGNLKLRYPLMIKKIN